MCSRWHLNVLKVHLAVLNVAPECAEGGTCMYSMWHLNVLMVAPECAQCDT